jgi:4-hydroxy-3-methylbut-2-enyl diphosphate reductase
MCFGVRDALAAAREAALAGPVVVLGELVHNPVVGREMAVLGVGTGDLGDVGSVPEGSAVAITAHGASDRDRAAWSASGRRVLDTTCPLVRNAHAALARLVAAGYAPVVVGVRGHVEVRGLTGDFPEAVVVSDGAEIDALPFRERFGVVSQTTQPLARVEALVARLRARHPAAEVRFVDTVCRPTKDRQAALEKLCLGCEVVVAVGGHNSNNTSELVRTARSLGVAAYQVSSPDELDPSWFEGARSVGVTAGTSTLDETVQAVRDRICQIAAGRGPADDDGDRKP